MSNWKNKVLSLVAAAALVIVPSVPASAAGEVNQPSESQQLLTLMNQARAENGLAPFSNWTPLNAPALDWSTRMSSSGSLTHQNISTILTDSSAAGCRGTAGENIAYTSAGTNKAQEIFTGYMNSPDHRAAILSTGYQYVGVGTVTNSAGLTYNTVRFSTNCATQTLPTPVINVTNAAAAGEGDARVYNMTGAVTNAGTATEVPVTIRVTSTASRVTTTYAAVARGTAGNLTFNVSVPRPTQSSVQFLVGASAVHTSASGNYTIEAAAVDQWNVVPLTTNVNIESPGRISLFSVGFAPASGQTVALEKLVGEEWVEVESQNDFTGQYYATTVLGDVIPETPQNITYRVVSGDNVSTSVTVAYKWSDAIVPTVVTGWPTETTVERYLDDTDITLDLNVTPARERVLDVQELVDGTWQTVSTSTAPATNTWQHSVVLPKSDVVGSRQFRLFSPATQWTEAYTSSVVTVNTNKFPLDVSGWPVDGETVYVYPDNTSGNVSVLLNVDGADGRSLLLSRDGETAVPQTIVEGENNIVLPFNKSAVTSYSALIEETPLNEGWTGEQFFVEYSKYVTYLEGFGEGSNVDIYEGDENTISLSGWYAKQNLPDETVEGNPVATVEYRELGGEWQEVQQVTLTRDEQVIDLPTPTVGETYQYRGVIAETEDYAGITTPIRTVNKVLAPVEVTGWESGSVTQTVAVPLVQNVTLDSPRDVDVFLQVWDADTETWSDVETFSGPAFEVTIPTSMLGVNTYRLEVRDQFATPYVSESFEVEVIRSVASVEWNTTAAYLNSGDVLPLEFTVLPLDGREVVLEASTDRGATWSTVETFAADAAISYTYEPTTTRTLLRVTSPETNWVSGITSASREVLVNVTPVTITGTPTGVNYVAATDDFDFTVSTNLADTTRNVELQKFELGEWVTVESNLLGNDRAFSVEPGAKGTISQYRLYVADKNDLNPGTTSEVFSVVSEAVPVAVAGWVSQDSVLTGTEKTEVNFNIDVAPYIDGETNLDLIMDIYDEQGDFVTTVIQSNSQNNPWVINTSLEDLTLGEVVVGRVDMRVQVNATDVNNQYTTATLTYQVVDGTTTVAGWPTDSIDKNVLETTEFDVSVIPNLVARSVELQEQIDGAWETVATYPYAAGASAVRVALPAVEDDLLEGLTSVTKTYRVSVPAAGLYEATTSGTLDVNYTRAPGTLSLAVASDGYVVEKDSELYISATAGPVAQDVELQRDNGDGWETVSTIAVGTTPTQVSIPTDQITGRGEWDYRLVLPQSNTVTGVTSDSFSVKVIDSDQSVVNWVTGNIQVTPDVTEYVMEDVVLTPVLDDTRVAYLEKAVDGGEWNVVEELNLATPVDVTLATPAPTVTEQWRIRVEAQDYLPELITDTFSIETVKFATTVAGVWEYNETITRYVGETVSYDVALESDEARIISLQELVDGEWVDLGEFTGTLPVVTVPGANTYRLFVAETATASGFTSAELTVDSVLRPVQVVGWSAGELSTFIGQDIVLPVEVFTGNAPDAFSRAAVQLAAIDELSEPLDVSLQVNVDGEWTTVDTYENVTSTFDVTIPAQELGSFEYRLYAPATTTSAEFVSEVLAVDVTRLPTSITEAPATNEVYVGSDFSVNFTVNPTDLVRTATLQELVDGEWADVETLETEGGMVNFAFDTTVLGSKTYRVNVAETETHEGVASNNFNVDVVKFPTIVTGWETVIDVPSGTTVAPVVNFTVENLDNRSVYIERLVDGEWTRSAALTYTGQGDEGSFAFTLPLLGQVETSMTLSYRLVIEENETSEGYTSETLNVNYLAADTEPTVPPTNTGPVTTPGGVVPTPSPSTTTPNGSRANNTPSQSADSQNRDRLEDTGSEGTLALVGLSVLALAGGAGALIYRKRTASE